MDKFNKLAEALDRIGFVAEDFVLMGHEMAAAINKGPLTEEQLEIIKAIALKKAVGALFGNENADKAMIMIDDLINIITAPPAEVADV